MVDHRLDQRVHAACGGTRGVGAFDGLALERAVIHDELHVGVLLGRGDEIGGAVEALIEPLDRQALVRAHHLDAQRTGMFDDPTVMSAYYTSQIIERSR